MDTALCSMAVITPVPVLERRVPVSERRIGVARAVAVAEVEAAVAVVGLCWWD